MTRKFAIITESSTDLPKEYFEEHDVHCVEMGFTLNGVTYGGEDGEPLPELGSFYASLRNGAMPTTFQISPERARKHIESLVKEDSDVLVIAFSSGLSGTANSFAIAARDLSKEYPDRKIYSVDSLCASMGEGLLVDYVVRKADEGASIDETRDYAENLKLHICHEFTVDNLFHLKRGGRVSAATAVVGSMLKIKPILHVDDDGHLIAVGKTMGRKKSISALVDRMKERQILEKDDPIFISHADCPEDAEYLLSLLKPLYGDHRFYMSEIGSVIGTHSGGGTLAVYYRGSHR